MAVVDLRRERPVVLINVLVAAAGRRSADFCTCPAGELVYAHPGLGCDHDSREPRCACARTFLGIESLAPTTTARVIQVNLTETTSYTAAVRASLRRLSPAQPARDLADLASVLSDEALRCAAEHRSGTLIRRHAWRDSDLPQDQHHTPATPGHWRSRHQAVA